MVTLLSWMNDWTGPQSSGRVTMKTSSDYSWQGMSLGSQEFLRSMQAAAERLT